MNEEISEMEEEEAGEEAGEEAAEEAIAVKTGPEWWCSFLHSQPDACGLTQMLSSPPYPLPPAPPFPPRRRWRCQPLSRQSLCKHPDNDLQGFISPLAAFSSYFGEALCLQPTSPCG